MAVRNPIYWDGTTLKRMTSAQVEDIRKFAIRKYAEDPSVRLTMPYGSITGTLNAMTDTRLQAGVYSSGTGNDNTVDDGLAEFPQESVTAEPTTIEVVWQNIVDSTIAVSPFEYSEIFSAGEGSFPYYESGGDLIAMNQEDMLDTFIRPAITSMTSGILDSSLSGGMFYVSNTQQTLPEGQWQIPFPAVPVTKFPAEPIFRDTRADTTQYTAAGIPEDLDQPETVQDFWLYQFVDEYMPEVPTTLMMRKGSVATDIKRFTAEQQATMLKRLMRWAAVNDTGYRINYQFDSAGGPGQSLGDGITDTKLNGSGNWQTRFVPSDDYRAQEFPDGTATPQNTWYLKVFTN